MNNYSDYLHFLQMKKLWPEKVNMANRGGGWIQINLTYILSGPFSRCQRYLCIFSLKCTRYVQNHHLGWSSGLHLQMGFNSIPSTIDEGFILGTCCRDKLESDIQTAGNHSCSESVPYPIRPRQDKNRSTFWVSILVKIQISYAKMWVRV